MFRIPLIKPYITAEVKDAVCAVLDSGYLTEGPVTHDLERAFREFIGCRHALAVTSCTTGLEIALRALGIGPGDEVIVPDFTYPATADAVAIVGATAVLVDVSPDTLLMDYAAAERAITNRTKAIMPVSEFGNPLDYRRLQVFRDKYGLRIVEDAACAIGAEFEGVKTGVAADISVFSLHPRKFITTGEGGIVTTNDDKLAEWMDSYKHFGLEKTPPGKPLCFARIGTNYKLSNILAAVGVVQMRHAAELLARRRQLAQGYLDLLADVSGTQRPVTTPGGIHSWQSFCIHIQNRDAVMAELRAQGIEVQIGTYALHRQPAFAPGPQVRHTSDFRGSRKAADEGLVLPMFHDLSAKDQESVVTALRGSL